MKHEAYYRKLTAQRRRTFHVPCFMFRDEGIAGLVIIVGIALFLLSASILVAIQGNTSILSGQLLGQGDRAQKLAEAGIEDALIKVARNKSYGESYTLTETDGSVAVSVASSSPAIITATSTVTQGGVTVRRTIQASVTLDADGKITAITRTNL